MLHLVYVIAVIGLLFGITELFWRNKWFSHEAVRKFLHISLGTFIAFWPFILPWNLIILLAVGFICAIFVISNYKKLSNKFTIFKTIKKLDRHSHGEIYFSIGILLSALLTHNKYIFMAAILNLSIADGLAALVGKKYGAKSVYTVFGAKKSALGSAVFWMSSLLILVFYYAISGHNPNIAMVILLPPIATFIESLSSSGVDNLVIPLTIIIALQGI